MSVPIRRMLAVLAVASLPAITGGWLSARAAESYQYVLVSAKSGNAELVLVDTADATGQGGATKAAP